MTTLILALSPEPGQVEVQRADELRRRAAESILENEPQPTSAADDEPPSTTTAAAANAYAPAISSLGAAATATTPSPCGEHVQQQHGSSGWTAVDVAATESAHV